MEIADEYQYITAAFATDNGGVLLVNVRGKASVISDSHYYSIVQNQPRSTETGFKKYLTNVILSGKITQSEYLWLAAIETEKDILSSDHQRLLTWIFADIRGGLIKVIAS